ncbi:MAG: tRNA-intron lyase [Candidatus Micrarchaeia archaeon]
MLSINFSNGKFSVEDQSTKDILKNGHFGKEINGILFLEPEEALYMMDVRNATCMSNGKELSFNSYASKFSKKSKFIAKYLTYKDWRDRGLIIKRLSYGFIPPQQNQMKRYPTTELKLPAYTMTGYFYSSDLLTIIEDKEKGREIYEQLWFGQYGSYKAADRGQLNKLDIYETLFLIDHHVLSLKNITKGGLVKAATARRHDFLKLYSVYKDWREKGYVLKTGFKFGTHFRIYFPGAQPIKNENWVHSKHVIHIFPKNSRLLISEWARAIRVAHSVRKTFILAIPGNLKEKKEEPDYILYHRKNKDIQTPEVDPPKYCMLSLSEEEYIGGRELAGALQAARNMKLDLVLAIADRETSVTYYKVKQIELPKSEYQYYEIDWMQP